MRRYGAKTLWTNSIFKNGRKFLNIYFSEKKLTIVVAFIYFCFLGANLAVLSGAFSCPSPRTRGAAAYCKYPSSALLTVLDLWASITCSTTPRAGQISEAIDNLNCRQYQPPIDTALFSGKEKELADNLNNISHGMEDVLKEQVKSERLKADLITNVSHDIKTPLTSIINYVDLIKREHHSGPEDPVLPGGAGAEIPAG